jgi:plastocyanin
VNIPVAPFVIFPESYWPAEPINTACVWDTEIEDCYEAYLFGYWMYDIPAGCTITFEVSIDGGNNWFVIAKVEGPAEAGAYEPIPCTMYDLTPFAGNRILVRTHVDNEGAGEGFLFIKDYMIYGKQDMIPPEVAISLSGNLIGGGQYAGPVTVTITATDNKGVKEIHYILDGGAETIVAGDTAVFTVNDDGDHTVTAWAVDILGNVGSSDSASFSIDATPPTVEITAPTPGLYLFGNQLLSMSKPFIIGAFTIEAVADDAQGVASVEFFLNGDSLGADLDAPYSIYCAEKNMGAAEITAVATDGVGNSAEDSLDVTYYKFL